MRELIDVNRVSSGCHGLKVLEKVQIAIPRVVQAVNTHGVPSGKRASPFRGASASDHRRSIGQALDSHELVRVWCVESGSQGGHFRMRNRSWWRGLRTPVTPAVRRVLFPGPCCAMHRVENETGRCPRETESRRFPRTIALVAVVNRAEHPRMSTHPDANTVITPCRI
jgi:hypothetical protein